MSAPAGAATTGFRTLFRRPTLEFLSAGLVGMLAFESLLGTYLAMFVEIPANGAIETLPIDALAVLTVHIVVGIALIVLCVRMVLISVRSKSRAGLALSGVALIGVLMAFAGGALFTGSGNEGMSFVMASGTFIAFLCAAVVFATASVRTRVGAPGAAPSR